MSLTGHGLHIHIHQHLDLKLHLVWKNTKNGVTTDKCIERVFPMYEDVERFCTELMNGTLEILCNCVCEEVLQFLEDNVELRFRAPPSQSQMKWSTYVPRSWIKT